MPEESCCREKFPAPPPPKSAKNVREFLDLAQYYRRFIDEFSQISKPLISLLRKNAKFVWGPDQWRPFETLREALGRKSIFQYPDFSKPFDITTDTFGYAIGAILSQGERERSTYRIRIAFTAECRIKLFYNRKSVSLESTRLIISDLMFRVTNLRLLQTIVHLCVRIQLTTAHHASSDGN